MSDKESFDPNSTNAMFATILTRVSVLTDEIKDFREEFRGHVKEVDARIKPLEADQSYRKGSVAVAAIVSSFLMSLLMSVATHWFTK